MFEDDWHHQYERIITGSIFVMVDGNWIPSSQACSGSFASNILDLRKIWLTAPRSRWMVSCALLPITVLHFLKRCWVFVLYPPGASSATLSSTWRPLSVCRFVTIFSFLLLILHQAFFLGPHQLSQSSTKVSSCYQKRDRSIFSTSNSALSLDLKRTCRAGRRYLRSTLPFRLVTLASCLSVLTFPSI